MASDKDLVYSVPSPSNGKLFLLVIFIKVYGSTLYVWMGQVQMVAYT